MTNEALRERLMAETPRCVDLVAAELGRPLTVREIRVIISALIRHHLAPDAPTTRLQ